MGGSRVLEVNVTSARDLKDVNLITKMDVYVIVKLKGDSIKKQKAKTQIHADAGSNPIWNFPIKFTVDDDHVHQNRLNLIFKLKSHRALGDKFIGKVVIPVTELLNSSEETSSSGTLSYPVITPSGKPHGNLYFSYKFGEIVATAAAVKGVDAGKLNSLPGSTSSAPAMAYPPPVGYPPQGENVGYPYQHPPQYGGYPPQYGAYPPPPTNGGYPPQGCGYPAPGYGAYPGQGGYGYPPMMMQQQKPKKGKSGMGMGLLGGMIGGLLIGDMIGDAAEMATMDMGGDF